MGVASWGTPSTQVTVLAVSADKRGPRSTIPGFSESVEILISRRRVFASAPT